MERMGEIRNIFIVDVTLVRISVKAFENPNNKATVCPSYTTPWQLSKGLGLLSQKYLHSNTDSCIVHNSKEMKSAEMSSDWRIDNENVEYMHNGILFRCEEKNVSCMEIDVSGKYHIK